MLLLKENKVKIICDICYAESNYNYYPLTNETDIPEKEYGSVPIEFNPFKVEKILVCKNCFYSTGKFFKISKVRDLTRVGITYQLMDNNWEVPQLRQLDSDKSLECIKGDVSFKFQIMDKCNGGI